MKNFVSILLLVPLAGCAGSPASDKSSAQRTDFALYNRGDGRETIQCQGVTHPICGSREVGPESIFSDCSDDQFECIVSAEDVLAVPKAGLTLGQTYSVFGAAFTVEQCFIDRATCEIARISSRCADEQSCKCRVFGQRTTIFYFSRDRGVATFYSVRDDLESIGVDAKLLAESLPMMTYVLAAEKGFLGTRLGLPRAEPRKSCESAGAVAR